MANESSTRASGSLFVLLALLSFLAWSQSCLAGTFILAGESNGVDLILHPQGYTGTQNALTVEVCIDPASLIPSGALLTDMEQAVRNNIATWNQLTPLVGNSLLGTANNIPSGQLDFESVALHELGHCIGLGHVNAASESGLSGNDTNYTKATDGVNNTFDINPGSDGVRGTLDDVRGDDINLHWFRTDTNDPGELPLPVPVDNTTYDRDLSSLPTGHLFAQNLDRTVAGTLGYPNTSTINTEAVMQQGTFSDEAQRGLTADGVATIMLGMSGVDETAGTTDDYTLTLVYGGISSASSCDLTMSFTSTSSLAFCSVSGAFISSPPGTTHARITTAHMEFGTGYNWFFNQVGNNCSYSISPTSNTFTSSGGSGSFDVTAPAGCSWTPSKSGSWITLTTGGGSGNGQVAYSVAANPSNSPRSGTITVQGKTYSITQSGNSCSYSISPTSNTFTSSGGSGSFDVTAPAGCSWTPSKSGSWITLTTGGGSGNGQVAYSVAANPSSIPRSGTITVQGKTYSITQSGISCSYSISPNSNSFTSSGGGGSFGVTAPAGCSWTPGKSASWITLTSGGGSGNGQVAYSVAANPGSISRSGTITVQDKTYSITQSGVSCSYSISPNSNSFTSSGGGGSFGVTAPAGCSWTPGKSDSWITLTTGGGSGNGQVAYNVAANPGSISRSGTITVQDKTYSISESGVACNTNVVSGTTESARVSHEACDILTVGPSFTAKDSASVTLSSGKKIEVMPRFTIEKGATLKVNICGQSLCKTSTSPMPYGCHSCVDQICDIDPSCCDTGFDQACLDKVDTVCGLVCK